MRSMGTVFLDDIDNPESFNEAYSTLAGSSINSIYNSDSRVDWY